MEKKFDKKIFWKTLLTVLVCFIVYKVVTTLLGKIAMSTTVYFFIRELIMLICGVISVVYLGYTSYLRPSGKYFGTGILVGLILVIIPCIIFILMIPHITVTVGVLGVILFVVSMIFVGIGEEALFRGALLNGLMDAYGEGSVKSIRIACIVSGVIFGLVHIFNVVTGAPLISSIFQGICNIPTGMLFGAIFIRSHKNLWPGIVLHAWLDFISFTQDGVLQGVSLNDSLGTVGVNYFVMALVELFIALLVLRTKKLEPLVVKEETEAAAE